MALNLDDARELVAEADRLLGRAWEQFPRSRTGLNPSDVEVAEHCYGQAAQAYLAAAAEYQRGRPAPESFDVSPTELAKSLDGRLRVEAEAALRVACEVDQTLDDARVEQTRILAEELRERFVHAAPELFNRSIEAGLDRPQGGVWSR